MAQTRAEVVQRLIELGICEKGIVIHVDPCLLPLLQSESQAILLLTIARLTAVLPKRT
jgi:hypothetical protein